jgi:DNA-binding response OmpR family regulator
MTIAMSELSILVADDDTEMRNSVVRVLKGAVPDIRLLEAHNGNLAMEIVTVCKPLLAILDGYMQPGPSGPEIVRFLRRDRSDIRTRCLVTSADRLMCANARELGADVLPKPYDVEHLKAYVRSVVQHARHYGNGRPVNGE